MQDSVHLPQDQQSLLGREVHLEQTERKEHSLLTLSRQSLKALPMAPVLSLQICLRTSLEMVVQSLPRMMPISLNEVPLSSSVWMVVLASKSICLFFIIMLSSNQAGRNSHICINTITEYLERLKSICEQTGIRKE